jgi:phosphoribosylaminoimidazole-succinocarboxamide synthase
MIPQAFSATNLPLADKLTGKVRDSYPLSENRRLLITTDRLSAFDKVLQSVAYKGQVLNQLSAWWFSQLTDIIPNHLMSLPDPNALEAIEVTPFPVEVIVRGYITGVTSTALWYRYSLGERNIYGVDFPEGLQKNQLLPTPIITPTTKGGPTGHDERLTCAEIVDKGLLDRNTWDYIQSAALAIFDKGQKIAAKSGLLLVDTKYEFGLDKNGRIILIDEVHTPDSSRFWKKESYLTRFQQQQEPENFDKEMVRLEYNKFGYKGEGQAPTLPESFWHSVTDRYIQVYELLTGQSFVKEPYPVEPRLMANLTKAGIL